MSSEPSRYVQPELNDARVNRLWGNVSARLEARKGRIWRGIGLSLALSAAIAGAVFFTRAQLSGAGGEHAVLADAKLETAGDALAVTLDDGSQVSLASRSEVRVRGNQPNSVALQLARGEVTCDVTHRENRKFTVVAGDVEVRVVGTKFTVKTTPGDNPRVEVSVLRGVVEVVSRRRPDVIARVAAGQSWIQNPEPSAVAPGNAADVTAPATPAPETDKKTAAAADVKSAAALAPSAAPAGPSARELFEKAGESRRAGDAAGAARAYEELLKLHPSDGRASLSAFELGRLRMDRLGDRAGAIVALERALASNLGPSFREDALARLVSVHAAQGNYAACGRARDRYLASYPAGVHAAAVATRCGTR